MKREKQKWTVLLKYIIALLLLLGLTLLAIRFAPELKRLLTARSTVLKLEEWIESFGVWGVLVLFFLQVLQVFIAIIPSEPIEIAAGICYGGFWGFALCMGGVLLGSLLVFKLIRRFGTPFVERLVSQKKLKEFNFLKDTKRMEGITFILYFIPGLPKDVFTYFAALTSIPLWNFLWISLIARVPSILVSTIAGAQYMEGNYRATLIIFAVFAALGVIGMVIYRMVSARLNRRHEVAGEGRGKDDGK